MRPFYQTEWLDIAFSSFAEMSFSSLPGTLFYGSFYQKFFERYDQMEELKPSWLESKNNVADFIKARFSASTRILSVGCGLGIIEKRLLGHFRQIEVTEISATPLRWIAPLLPPQNVHVGFFPDCIPPERDYDLILLSAIDYSFGTPEWIAFLKSLKTRLVKGGQCLIVSASFDPQGNRLGRFLKELIKGVVYGTRTALKIPPKKQFWGYLRTQKDYYSSLQVAGYVATEEGFTSDGLYWIKGQNA